MGQVTLARSLHARNHLLAASAFTAGTEGWVAATADTSLFSAFGLMVIERTGAVAGNMRVQAGNATSLAQYLAPLPDGYAGVSYLGAHVSASTPAAVALGVMSFTGTLTFIDLRLGAQTQVTAGPGAPQWAVARLATPPGTGLATPAVFVAGAPPGLQVYVHRVQLAFRPFTVWSQGPLL